MHKDYILDLGNFVLEKYSIRVYNASVPKMSISYGGDNLKYPNIEAERARSGMSKGVLADTLGVSRKTLYNWVTAGNIPQSALEKMAGMFGCSIDYLLGRQEY